MAALQQPCHNASREICSPFLVRAHLNASWASDLAAAAAALALAAAALASTAPAPPKKDLGKEEKASTLLSACA